ncbi:MAG: hypothetical protein SVU88_01170 [Candidatus Nanohaloarchaea archaeon]|nr:hypothetical protein [Candidatus Nanohaloarchaea archaeon]
MDLENLFGRKVLEAYLAVAVLVLTAAAYVILANVGFADQSGLVMVSILLIILIGVNILLAIIQLRILDAVQ